MDIRELLQTTEYDFLRTDPHLGERIILLGVGGSYGYGTNREGSDVDLRGITLNFPSELIGLDSFEQFEDRQTDTVIYSFNKLVRLLLNCNPNTIELLGLDEDQYFIRTELGDLMLENRDMFLSKRAAASFGHYADAQLRRLQNAIARDSMSQPQREGHMLKSANYALADFVRRHEDGPDLRAELYMDEAVTEGFETEIFLDVTCHHAPLRDYNEFINTLITTVRNYDKVGKRNHKKDERHLNKHAMHLIRLFMMGIDILQKAEIRTHRPESDLQLLRSVRDGAYMQDGILNPEFYEIVADYERRFEEAERNSILPDNPDMDRINRFTQEMNLRTIRGEF